MPDLDTAGKTLKILGILSIISGVLGIIMGALSFAGSGMIAGGMATPGTIDPSEMDTAAAATGMLLFVGAMLVISGIITLLLGIFSVRASNDYSKIGPAYVFAIINLALTIITIVANLVVSGIDLSSLFSNFVSIVLSGAIFWAARTIRNNA